MRRLTNTAFGVSILLATLGPAPLLAQCLPGGPPNPAAVKQSIVGLVLDRANQPIENADVFIRNPRRQARTRADGHFQLMDLDTGTYEVIVRRIGYSIAAWEYVVPDSGGVARFCLAREARILPPSISSVRRGGLSGIIGDSVLKPLPGADVRAVGAGEHTMTDSSGAFYLDLKRGTYAIVVSKPGYARQLVSVTIPKDSGRQITAFLGSPPRNANRMAAMLDLMRDRMLMAPPSRSGIMSNEDLLKTEADLRGAAQKTARTGVADDCEAVIDGGPYSLPVHVIDKRDVAMLEVYALAPARRSPISMNPRGTTGIRTPSGGRCNVRIYVWMKP
jgi:hypothetical protein